MAPIRWLHLSDLHLGCRGEVLWAQVQEEFERSIREHAEKLGMPDLILLTGDLTFRGSEEQFGQVDDLLEVLRGWLLEATGSTQLPLVAPIATGSSRPPCLACSITVAAEKTGPWATPGGS